MLKYGTVKYLVEYGENAHSSPLMYSIIHFYFSGHIGDVGLNR